MQPGFRVAEAIHRNRKRYVVCDINKQPQMSRKISEIGNIAIVKVQLQYSEDRKIAQLQLRSHQCSKVNTDRKNRKTMQGVISNGEVALLSPTNLISIYLVLSGPNQLNMNRTYRTISFYYGISNTSMTRTPNQAYLNQSTPYITSDE